ncbi:MAG: histidine kinase [Bacteroidetes bacterium]|nr:histidine kinase [Bacteroidota bacterium]
MKLFFNLNNPVIYSILLIFIIVSLIYIMYVYVFSPLQAKHKRETQALENKSDRMMALLAEIDPDPVIRTDTEGKIIFTNESAKLLFNIAGHKDDFIKKLISQIGIPISDFIEKDRVKLFTQKINLNHYSILFKGISSLKIAQVYFHDITEKIIFEEKLKSFSKGLQSSIEEEKKRIAGELHDGIGQDLLLLKMDLFNNYKSIIERQGKHTLFKETIDLLERTILELRIILFNLKPPILEEMGLGPAIATIINKITESGLIKGSLRITGLDERLDRSLEINVYRIVQEALNNIIKHSKANEFSVQIMSSL